MHGIPVAYLGAGVHVIIKQSPRFCPALVYALLIEAEINNSLGVRATLPLDHSAISAKA